mmetsp:Transcript_35845/g.58605  ORF Transcript_35845/g.58605 Transcript_35845/m.58605 type:complete len:143 (+) Transcript_35845:2741-3169(+)
MNKQLSKDIYNNPTNKGEEPYLTCLQYLKEGGEKPSWPTPGIKLCCLFFFLVSFSLLQPLIFPLLPQVCFHPFFFLAGNQQAVVAAEHLLAIYSTPTAFDLLLYDDYCDYAIICITIFSTRRKTFSKRIKTLLRLLWLLIVF